LNSQTPVSQVHQATNRTNQDKSGCQT